MTRWARAKNALQQQKQPEESTPWRTFIKERKKFKDSGSSITTDVSTIHFQNLIKKNEKKLKENKNISQIQKEKPSSTSKEQHLEENASGIKFFKKKKMKPKETILLNNNKEENKGSTKKKISCDMTKDNSVKNSYVKKKKNKSKKSHIVLQNRCTSPSTQEINELDHSFPETGKLNDNESSEKSIIKQKKIIIMREKLMKKRTQQGLLLLPQKVEEHIYKLKKTLRKKGIPNEDIKRIIRRKRRNEELKYRKDKSNKVCFKCRQDGHHMSECPLIQEDSGQGTDICFKCGSTEHISRYCHLKASSFSYAVCFICNQQGHLSRQCPQNKNGIYPKGGCCRECGSVQHFKKDCPQLQRVKEIPQVTAHIMDLKASADADISDTLESRRPITVSKVVKF